MDNTCTITPNLTDPATSLRMRMAQHNLTVADVCRYVDRNAVTVSRWRHGHTRIPIDSAKRLHANGLLDASALAQLEALR